MKSKFENRKSKMGLALLLGTLAERVDRFFRNGDSWNSSLQRRRDAGAPVALANSGLGLFSEHGTETLQIDPGATVPVGSKWLVYERGSAYNYARVAGGVNLPLGVSADAPYALGDYLEIRRFGAKKGFELGIPGGAITIDHLVYVATDGTGHLLDLTAAGNGTFWVVGRCKETCAATDIEVAFVPCSPYEITVSNGGGTYALAGAGV